MAGTNLSHLIRKLGSLADKLADTNEQELLEAIVDAQLALIRTRRTTSEAVTLHMTENQAQAIADIIAATEGYPRSLASHARVVGEYLSAAGIIPHPPGIVFQSGNQKLYARDLSTLTESHRYKV